MGTGFRAVSALRPGDVVVMDNLGSHKVAGVREVIEKAWSKLKQLLRSAKARTSVELEIAITEALKLITADDAQAWFRLPLNWVQS